MRLPVPHIVISLSLTAFAALREICLERIAVHGLVLQEEGRQTVEDLLVALEQLLAPGIGLVDEPFDFSVDLGGGLLAASRAELAAVALREYEQNGNIKGGGKVYWSYWNKGVEAWCVDFVYYCGDQIGLVGQDKPFGPYTAACTTAWSQLKAQGAFAGMAETSQVCFF